MMARARDRLLEQIEALARSGGAGALEAIRRAALSALRTVRPRHEPPPQLDLWRPTHLFTCPLLAGTWSYRHCIEAQLDTERATRDSQARRWRGKASKHPGCNTLTCALGAANRAMLGHLVEAPKRKRS